MDIGTEKFSLLLELEGMRDDRTGSRRGEAIKKKKNGMPRKLAPLHYTFTQGLGKPIRAMIGTVHLHRAHDVPVVVGC